MNTVSLSKQQENQDKTMNHHKTNKLWIEYFRASVAEMVSWEENMGRKRKQEQSASLGNEC